MGDRAQGRPWLLVMGVAPDRAGVGVEQRAARTLSALARRGPVQVVWFGARPFEQVLSPSLRGAVAGVTSLGAGSRARLDLGRWLRRLYVRLPWAPPPPSMLARPVARALPFEGAAAACPEVGVLRAALGEASFAGVHGFRLTSAPLVVSLRALAPRVSVDVDDVESDTLADIGALARREGDRGLAWLMQAQGEAAWRFEQRWLSGVDRLACCSEDDAARLGARFPGAQVHVLPNAITMPRESARGPGDPACLRLLTVGALGYYPNIDAVRFLAEQVLPPLAARLAPRAVELHVVGRGASVPLRRLLERLPGVVFHGEVVDLDPIYARADVALCAVRAGGGTRIKILEAFARRRPVVSTRRGAAGMPLCDGEQLRFAETPAQFVDALVHIAHNAGVPGMVERALRFVIDAHGEGAFDRAMQAITA